MEPISIFGRALDRAAVAQQMRELASDVKLEPAGDGEWRRLTATFGRFFGKKRLVLTYDPEHCSGPNWAQQMDGMRGYYSRFVETDQRKRVLWLTETFTFVLGTLLDPEAKSSDDPRIQAIHCVAQRLDAVLFTPSELMDARGCVLFGVHGSYDPRAVWPNVSFVPRKPTDAADGAVALAVDRENEDEDEGEEHDPEATAPDAARVAMRALALAALSQRAMLEWQREDPATADTRRQLIDWAGEVGVLREMEEHEREIVRAPLGSLDPKALVNAMWRLEGVAILAWALGLGELPAHDAVTQPPAHWQRLGVCDVEAAHDLLANPLLRPRDEIATARDRLFALHWRLRNFTLRRGAMDFAEFARTAWFGPLDIAGLPLVEGDLAIEGTRIDRVDPELFSRTHSAVMERHLALNWLWEGPADYSEADTST